MKDKGIFLSRLFPMAVGYALVFGIFFSFSFKKIENSDFGFYLAIGNYIQEEKALPRVEKYSYWAEGEENKIVAWLSFWIFYLLYAGFGYEGLTVFRSFVFGLLGCFVVLSIFRKKGYPFSDPTFRFFCIAATIVFLMAGIQMRLFVRAEMFAYLILSAYLTVVPVALESTEFWRRKSFYLLFVLQTLWTNLHLSFLVGLVYAGLFLFDRWWRQGLSLRGAGAGVMPLLCLSLGTLFNPQGLRIYDYFFGLVLGGEVNHILEWRPLFQDFSLYSQEAFYLYAGAGAAFYFYLRNDFFSALTLVFFGFLAVKANRNLPMYTLVAAPLICPVCYEILRELKGRIPMSLRKAYAVLGLTAILFMGVHIRERLNFRLYGKGLSFEEYPLEAIRFIREHELKGRMFNDFSLGGFLMWTLYPDYQVFIDGRTQVYGVDRLKTYRRLVVDPDRWESLLRRYDIQFAVAVYPEIFKGQVVNNTAPLFPPDLWSLVYFDRNAIVLVRKDGPNRDVAPAYRFIDPFSLSPKYLDRHIREGRDSEIEAELRRNLRESPENYRADYLLAYLYAHKRLPEEPKVILHHLKRVFAADPGYRGVTTLIADYERRMRESRFSP